MLDTQMKYFILIFAIFIFACTSNNETSKLKTLDFGSFTIQTPNNWTKKKVKGIDSYVGQILLDSSDVLTFDLGPYSNDLTEYQEVIMADGKRYYINSNDTSAIPTLIDSTRKYEVIKSNVLWDTIDGRLSKLLTPIHSGIGTTGIYVDSLWGIGNERDRFNLYGINLKSTNEKAVIEAFQTIKFYQDK